MNWLVNKMYVEPRVPQGFGLSWGSLGPPSASISALRLLLFLLCVSDPYIQFSMMGIEMTLI